MFSHKDHSRLANLYQSPLKHNPLKVEFILGTVLANMSWRQWLIQTTVIHSGFNLFEMHSEEDFT